MEALQKINSSLELSPIFQTALEKLEPDQKHFIQAALQPQLSKCERGQCTDQIIEAIAYAFTISGQKVDAADLVLHGNETYEWLLRAYPYVTVAEIKEALKRGIYDEYGEYFGLNAKTFVFFIKSYFNSAEREKAKEAFEKSKLLARPTDKPEISRGTYMRWIQRDYDLFRSGQGYRILYSNQKYFLLRKLKFIEFTSIDKWKVWLYKAKREQIVIAKCQKDKTLTRHLVSVYNELESTGHIHRSEMQRVVIQARKMIYTKFLSIMDDFLIQNIFQEVETEIHKIKLNQICH